MKKLTFALGLFSAALAIAAQEPAPSREWVRAYVDDAINSKAGTNIVEMFDVVLASIRAKASISTNSVVSPTTGERKYFGATLKRGTLPAIVATFTECPLVTNVVYWAWDKKQQAFVNNRFPLIPKLMATVETNVVTTTREEILRTVQGDEEHQASNITIVVTSVSTNVTPLLYAPRDGNEMGWYSYHNGNGATWIMRNVATNHAEATWRFRINRAKITQETYDAITAQPARRMLFGASNGGSSGDWDYEDVVWPDDVVEEMMPSIQIGSAKDWMSDPQTTIELDPSCFIIPPNYGGYYTDGEHGGCLYPDRESAKSPDSYFEKRKNEEGVDVYLLRDVAGDEYEIPVDLFNQYVNWDQVEEAIDGAFKPPVWVEDDDGDGDKPPIDRYCQHKWKNCVCTRCGKTWPQIHEGEPAHDFRGSPCHRCVRTGCTLTPDDISYHNGWRPCDRRDDDGARGIHCQCECKKFGHDAQTPHLTSNTPDSNSYSYVAKGMMPKSWGGSSGHRGTYSCHRSGCTGRIYEYFDHTMTPYMREYGDNLTCYRWLRCTKCNASAESTSFDDEAFWDETTHVSPPGEYQYEKTDTQHRAYFICGGGAEDVQTRTGCGARIYPFMDTSLTPPRSGWSDHDLVTNGIHSTSDRTHAFTVTCRTCGYTDSISESCLGHIIRDPDQHDTPVSMYGRCICSVCRQSQDHFHQWSDTSAGETNACGLAYCKRCGKSQYSNTRQFHKWFGNLFQDDHYCLCGGCKENHDPERAENPYRETDDELYYMVTCFDCGYRLPDEVVHKDGKSGTDEENEKSCSKNYGDGEVGCKHGGGSRPGHEIGDWTECRDGGGNVVDKQTTKECNCPDMPEGGTCPVCGVNVPAPQEDEPPYRDEEVSRELKVVMLDVPPPIQTWQITIRRTWKDGKVEIIHKVENVWPL